MNVHTPERGADETRRDYRTRRALSRAIARRLAHPTADTAETGSAKPDIALMSLPLINLLTRFFRGA